MATRSGFYIAFFVTLLGAGGYWYYVAGSECRIPLTYDIGEIDSRFSISKEEIKAALSDSESLWEDATRKNLFTYQSGAKFKVNFVYDDRQDTTTKEGQARTELDKTQEASERVRAEYERVVQEYDALRSEHEGKIRAYEKRLAIYNAEVTRANAAGGASKEEFVRLEKEKKELADLQASLNASTKQMNALAQSVNTLGEKGNLSVKEYNTKVSWYNNLFGYSREFTQGDYQGNRINIYQFDSPSELRNVLAHELGHALSLQHVDDPTAIMYFLMDEQAVTSAAAITEADTAEFARVCGK